MLRVKETKFAVWFPQHSGHSHHEMAKESRSKHLQKIVLNMTKHLLISSFTLKYRTR